MSSQSSGGEEKTETGQERPRLAGPHHDQSHSHLISGRGWGRGCGQVPGGDVIHSVRANVRTSTSDSSDYLVSMGLKLDVLLKIETQHPRILPLFGSMCIACLCVGEDNGMR